MTATVDSCPVASKLAIAVHDMVVGLCRAYCAWGSIGPVTEAGVREYFAGRDVATDAIAELVEALEGSGQSWEVWVRQARQEGLFELRRQLGKRGHVDDRTVDFFVNFGFTLVRQVVLSNERGDTYEQYVERARRTGKLVAASIFAATDGNVTVQ
jgi:hypothetical protein